MREQQEINRTLLHLLWIYLCNTKLWEELQPPLCVVLTVSQRQTHHDVRFFVKVREWPVNLRMEKNNKLGTDKEIWADKHKVSDGVREEKTRGEIAKAKRGWRGGRSWEKLRKRNIQRGGWQDVSQECNLYWAESKRQYDIWRATNCRQYIQHIQKRPWIWKSAEIHDIQHVHVQAEHSHIYDAYIGGRTISTDACEFDLTWNLITITAWLSKRPLRQC